jgi:hypothetical protein
MKGESSPSKVEWNPLFHKEEMLVNLMVFA